MTLLTHNFDTCRVSSTPQLWFPTVKRFSPSRMYDRYLLWQSICLVGCISSIFVPSSLYSSLSPLPLSSPSLPSLYTSPPPIPPLILEDMPVGVLPFRLTPGTLSLMEMRCKSFPTFWACKHLSERRARVCFCVCALVIHVGPWVRDRLAWKSELR